MKAWRILAAVALIVAIACGKEDPAKPEPITPVDSSAKKITFVIRTDTSDFLGKIIVNYADAGFRARNSNKEIVRPFKLGQDIFTFGGDTAQNFFDSGCVVGGSLSGYTKEGHYPVFLWLTPDCAEFSAPSDTNYYVTKVTFSVNF